MRNTKFIPLVAVLTVAQAQVPPVPPPPVSDTSTLPVTPMAPTTAPSMAPARAEKAQGNAQIINFASREGTTKLEMHGTPLAPQATCMAKVKCRDGGAKLTAKLRDLPPADSLGGNSLTYVMWGISPEGEARNLGELVAKNGKCKIKVTQPTQAFGIIVTAEPYFAVSQPSDRVILDTAGWKDPKDQPAFTLASYSQQHWEPLAVEAGQAPMADDKAPYEVLQASNAVKLARAAGANLHAGEALGKAEALFTQAQVADSRKKDRIIAAREAVQVAEDARMKTLQVQDAQRVAMERKNTEAQLESARMAASRAVEAAAQAQLQASASLRENDKLHDKLKQQLSAVLETRESARGLIVNMSGVLFRSGKAELVPAAREKLAKIAGILAAHKGLKIEADGYTDSSGSEAFNSQLSERRAMVTRDFLVGQGVSKEAIIFHGYGEQNPISSNDTVAGRQENRRVELVVTGISGETKAP